MSTVDPVRERAEREAARRGSPARVVRHVMLQALQFIFAVLLGMGVVTLIDTSRVTELNSVFGTWDSRLQDLIWTVPVGMVGVILFGIAVGFSANSLTGRPLAFPVVGPATVVLVGVAIGFTVLVPWLTPPDEVGIRLDETYGESETWGLGEWVWYHIDVWGPIVLWALAIGAAAIGAIARIHRRARRPVLDEVLAIGVRVPGEVTEAPLPDPHATRTITRITVCYTDRSGTTRWVEPVLAMLTQELPRRGDLVSVAYDPNAPGDTKRIFVGPADARDAADFRRWSFDV
ncbi:MAG: hypothetical protein QM604_11045 [Microbacterium sp.]